MDNLEISLSLTVVSSNSVKKPNIVKQNASSPATSLRNFLVKSLRRIFCICHLCCCCNSIYIFTHHPESDNPAKYILSQRLKTRKPKCCRSAFWPKFPRHIDKLSSPLLPWSDPFISASLSHHIKSKPLYIYFIFIYV